MKSRYLLTAAFITLIGTEASAQPMPGQRLPANDPNGTYCREYQQVVTVGGRRQDSYGTACQQSDGSWKILPSDVQAQADENTPPIEYVGEPQYISPPVYTVPPPVYYQPQPYYGSTPYPYAGPYYGNSFSLGFSSGGGYRRGGYGGYHRHF